MSDICGGHTVLMVPESVWGRNQGTRWLPESHCYQHHGWFPGLAFLAHSPDPSLWLHRLHRPIDYRVTCDNQDYWTWRCPGSEPVCSTEASLPWAQTLKQRERVSAMLWVWGSWEVCGTAWRKQGASYTRRKEDSYTHSKQQRPDKEKLRSIPVTETSLFLSSSVV